MFAAIAFLLLGSFHSPCDSPHFKSASGIRAIDFCNFDYPGVNYTEEIVSSQETTVSKSDPVKVFTASFTLRSGARPASEEGDLITLDEIKYVKVTHDGREAAILCLADHSGGTMITDFLYVWSAKGSKPVLLWSYPLGDRGDLGLYRVYARKGDLILELNDPDFREGDCCSSRFIRLRYHWTGRKFHQVAKASFAKPANAYKIVP